MSIAAATHVASVEHLTLALLLHVPLLQVSGHGCCPGGLPIAGKHIRVAEKSTALATRPVVFIPSSFSFGSLFCPTDGVSRLELPPGNPLP